MKFPVPDARIYFLFQAPEEDKPISVSAEEIIKFLDHFLSTHNAHKINSHASASVHDIFAVMPREFTKMHSDIMDVMQRAKFLKNYLSDRSDTCISFDQEGRVALLLRMGGKSSADNVFRTGMFSLPPNHALA